MSKLNPAHVVLLLAALFVFSVLFASCASVRKGGAALDPRGTWVLAEAVYNGQTWKPPYNVKRVKVVSDETFVWFDVSTVNGYMSNTSFGSWTAGPGESYAEYPFFGSGEDGSLVQDQEQAFTGRIEGDYWYHEGFVNGSIEIHEVWCRYKYEQSAVKASGAPPPTR